MEVASPDLSMPDYYNTLDQIEAEQEGYEFNAETMKTMQSQLNAVCRTNIKLIEKVGELTRQIQWLQDRALDHESKLTRAEAVSAAAAAAWTDAVASQQLQAQAAAGWT